MVTFTFTKELLLIQYTFLSTPFNFHIKHFSINILDIDMILNRSNTFQLFFLKI